MKWFHAGPLLYGDWGTSRLYVLGLAFLFTAHASVIYLAAISLLMLAVSWAYTIICKSFPDGGGVYTAARRINPTLAIVGSTLLLSGYIMTAAISVVEAFHYFGVPHALTLPLSVITLVLLGAVNWLGAKSAGRFALVVAFGALAVSAVMAVACLPFFWKGITTINFEYFQQVPASDAWVSFTKICLALAGVEAVANMTGLMKEPVGKTAKRTIWPVTIEVVALNMVFGIALAGLDLRVDGTTLADLHEPHELLVERGELSSAGEATVDRYTNASMKVIAERTGDWWSNYLGPAPTPDEAPAGVPNVAPTAPVIAHEHVTSHDDHHNVQAGGADTAAGFVFGKIAGVCFGLLLLSATNTAIMAMVSVLFAMAQDDELPKPLAKLNYSGVPWVGLIVSVLIPIAVITVEQDVTILAKLYVLGVCGAITVSILSTVFNPDLTIGRWSRIGMISLGLFLLAVTVTIGVTQWFSAAFSGGLVAAVLLTRAGRRAIKNLGPGEIPEPTAGWLAQVKASTMEIDPNKPRVMLAARGRYQAEFAVDLARRRGATLFAIYVRTLRVMDIAPGRGPQIEDDADAQAALGASSLLAAEAGVAFVPIYVTATDISGEILDYTVTYGCDTLIMGKSRRSLFARRLEGDVVTAVAEHLPDGVALITRSADTPHVARKADGAVVAHAVIKRMTETNDSNTNRTDDHDTEAHGGEQPRDGDGQG
ncbi:MAG: universal stress protein [Planctomycetota bacterium]